MADITLTTMVMVENPATGEVLIQDRLSPRFHGYSFPGGHVEASESVYDCAVREVLEETGLTVSKLKPCGLVHWCEQASQNRYLVFLFKTAEFSGELIPKMEEGRHFWMPIEALKQHKFTNDLPIYFPMFLEEKYSEAFCPWHEDEPWQTQYKGETTI